MCQRFCVNICVVFRMVLLFGSIEIVVFVNGVQVFVLQICCSGRWLRLVLISVVMMFFFILVLWWFLFIIRMCCVVVFCLVMKLVLSGISQCRLIMCICQFSVVLMLCVVCRFIGILLLKVKIIRLLVFGVYMCFLLGSIVGWFGGGQLNIYWLLFGMCRFLVMYSVIGFRNIVMWLFIWFSVVSVCSICIVLLFCEGYFIIRLGMLCSVVIELLLWKWLLKFFWQFSLVICISIGLWYWLLEKNCSEYVLLCSWLMVLCRQVRYWIFGIGSMFRLVRFWVMLRIMVLFSSVLNIWCGLNVLSRFLLIVYMFFFCVMFLLNSRVEGYLVISLCSVWLIWIVRWCGGRCLGSCVVLLWVVLCVIGFGRCLVLVCMVVGEYGVSGVMMFFSVDSFGW